MDILNDAIINIERLNKIMYVSFCFKAPDYDFVAMSIYPGINITEGYACNGAVFGGGRPFIQIVSHSQI